METEVAIRTEVQVCDATMMSAVIRVGPTIKILKHENVWRVEMRKSWS